MKSIATKLLLLLAAWLPVQITVAQNLVPNPGFENGSCVVNYNSTPAKIPTTIDNWYSASGTSPDPFDICGTALPAAYDVFVPDVLFGYQYARTGNRFMGLGFYNAPWYEYIGVKLTAPLEAGETYHVSFWVSCGDLMSWAADQVGMYFSTTEIKYPSTTTIGVLNFTPQVVNPVGRFLTDTTWQEISGNFVAAGGEQWIVIGYFKTAVASDFLPFPVTVAGQAPKANPNYKPGTGGTGGSPRAYYYIDDVTVIKTAQGPLPIGLAGFSAKIINQQVRLNWKTLTENNNCSFEIERSDDGLHFTKVGTVAGARNSSTPVSYQFTDIHPAHDRTYYRLQQLDCDGRFSYSKTVNVRFEAAAFAVFPNPVTSQLIIDRNNATVAQAHIYDASGKLLRTHRLATARATIAVDDLLPGAYVIKVANEKGVYTQKFFKP